MEYVYDYLVFLAEAVTIVLALLIVISAIASLSMKHQHEASGHLAIAKLNDRLKALRQTMESSVLPPDVAKKQHKAEAKAESKTRKAEAQALKQSSKAPTKVSEDSSADPASSKPDDERVPRHIYFLQFQGDTRASGVDKLRREINAVLTMATSEDEVVVAVESPGGMVPNYGLAASQLTRFRDHNIPLTVVVDKVAASGGYLMAVVANRIIAAPFALVGSIGVVAQIPNVHKLLKKNDVDVEVLTAGKYKRTLTMFGENTEEGREKFLAELEDIHALFQEFVAEFRPDMDLETVATGEAWFGRRAIELNLVDGIATSDELLMQACKTSDVYAISWHEQKKPIERILGHVNGVLERAEDVLARFSMR